MDTVTPSSMARGRRESYGNAQFGSAPPPPPPPQRGSIEPDFEEIRDSAEFVALRRRLRSFIFPMGALFLAWYFSYVLLSDYLPGFMSAKVFGNINVGLILGLLQFVSTAALTLLYVRFANKRIDPHVAQIREQTRRSHQ